MSGVVARTRLRVGDTVPHGVEILSVRFVRSDGTSTGCDHLDVWWLAPSASVSLPLRDVGSDKSARADSRPANPGAVALQNETDGDVGSTEGRSE